ncbi:MAG: hypothetical protein WCF22_04410, partial [Candidatus Sulfotelmatobacter sp.]
VLHKLIPATVSEFAKLEAGQPYYFDHWANDRYDSPSLYYWFDSNDGAKLRHKRVVISEIHKAFQHHMYTGKFDRKSFRSCCPQSDSSGHCGFVVVGRIFEALGVAEYSGRENGFVKPSLPVD